MKESAACWCNFGRSAAYQCRRDHRSWKRELLSALEQPITAGVPQRRGAASSLFERLHKRDMVAAQRLLNQYQSDLEAMMRQETRRDDTPPEEVKAQA